MMDHFHDRQQLSPFQNFCFGNSVLQSNLAATKLTTAVTATTTQISILVFYKLFAVLSVLRFFKQGFL